jgi:hypothetical protein
MIFVFLDFPLLLLHFAPMSGSFFSPFTTKAAHRLASMALLLFCLHFCLPFPLVSCCSIVVGVVAIEQQT